MPFPVEPNEVGAALALHRPPSSARVELRVRPRHLAGEVVHASVLAAVYTEMLTFWPPGTAMVVDYLGGAYTQAVAYPPALLTEIGPASGLSLVDAVGFGWLDPTLVPVRHADFESQRQWIDNPVREWTYPIDTLPDIAGFVAASIRSLLRANPDHGYVVTIWRDGS
jgi:hypothetical protein